MSDGEAGYLFQALVEQVSDGLIFADREGRVRLWNGGAEAIFGYTAEEILGRSLDVIIPEHLRRPHWAAFQRAIESGETRYGRQVLLTRAVHKSGDKLYVDLSFAIVKDGTGQVVGSVAVARDVTRRQQEQRALKRCVAELEEQLKALGGERRPANET